MNEEKKLVGGAVEERITLIVENSENVLSFLHSGIEGSGLKILSLQAMESDDQSLMVMDVEVSQTRGFEIVKSLGSISRKPVIVMNPVGTGGHLNLGPGEYVAPPFQPAELMTRISRLMNNRN